MSFNPGFEYKPLLSSTSIRILLINPGTEDDEIHCNFLPCDLNADHAKFPEYPRPVESMSVGSNHSTGRTFFMSFDMILDDAPGAPGQRMHPFQRYKALSYVWGDASELQTIKVENENFLVTRNLMAALKSVRGPDEAVKFWVDAICINQADPEEKKTQIPLMGRIYQQADSVMGQVLPSFDKTESFCELLVAIKTACLALETEVRARGRDGDQKSTAETVPSSARASGSLSFTQYALEDYNLPSAHSPLWQGWRDFFESPYFRRLWIQQEVVLAKDCVWLLGHTAINPQEIFTCIGIIERYSRDSTAAYFYPGGAPFSVRAYKMSADSVRAIENRMFVEDYASYVPLVGYYAAERMLKERKLAENSKMDRLLIKLLADYRDLCATEPCDMIFGLLGLAKDADRFYDLVSYSTPLDTLFVSLAQRFIDIGHGPELLLQASNTANKESLPSWVPNWSSSFWHPGPRTHRYMPIPTKDFSAGSEGVANAFKVTLDTQDRQRPVLRAHGAVIDTVQHCSLTGQAEELMPWMQERYGFIPPSDTRDTMLVTLFAQQAVSFAIEHVPEQHGVVSFVDVCCLAARDFNEEQMYHSFGLGFIQFVSMWMDHDFGLEQLRGNFKPRDEMLPMKDFIHNALWPLGQQRRFCATERGLLGVVPSECKPGDKVFILRGGAVPLILRPVESDSAVEDRNQRYQLIGDAYIRGVMYGEGLAFNGVQESDISLV